MKMNDFLKRHNEYVWQNEDGSTAETIVIMAVLVGLSAAVLGVISSAVQKKANETVNIINDANITP